MIKNLLALALFTLSVGTAVNAQTLNKPKLDSLLDVLAANNKTMGSLAISVDGKIIYQKSVGHLAVDAKTPADAHTKYRIGSISKVFTGVITFQLIEEKKLTLETTLDRFYPQIPNAAKITIAQLLSHHSGLFNFTNDPAFGSYMTTPTTHEHLLTKIAAFKPDFEPGAKYAYSNTNFLLLSYIIEKITGKPYAEVVKKRIIDKIGLKDTYYGGKINVAANEALSYNYAGSWKLMPESDMSIPTGAGAMVSTPSDLDKFIEALFAGKLIKAASLEQMKPTTENYGMAMHKMLFKDKTGYGHGGVIDGFLSSLAYFPEDKLAISYTKNGGSYSPDEVLKGALAIYFNQSYVIPSFVTAKAESLDKYTGVYACPALPIKITVTKDGSTLIAQATGQGAFPLDATTTPDKFVFDAAGIVMEFKPADGQFTLKQGGGEYVFTKEK
ncbi:serine hydrolase domain-containing protein [Mucilaginibacter psychrotolerans]|uniref:Class A beta-lactamase-related serine hydrolase n=1 Tax=Mucilaginibacter psychrotolerans TaxID=1524096 RepID=A0A4Y8S291_9SPHI|nr:serine hydrolase domain-containing protein [Mucilaginibacter psychrotolerans]TFF32153.1 class A beta-lactamase-related serine hydrolase [Mucilaginibacter psychrotolerans]